MVVPPERSSLRGARLRRGGRSQTPVRAGCTTAVEWTPTGTCAVIVGGPDHNPESASGRWNHRHQSGRPHAVSPHIHADRARRSADVVIRSRCSVRSNDGPLVAPKRVRRWSQQPACGRQARRRRHSVVAALGGVIREGSGGIAGDLSLLPCRRGPTPRLGCRPACWRGRRRRGCHRHR